MTEPSQPEVRARVARLQIFTNRELAPAYDNIAAGRIFAEVFKDKLRYNLNRRSWAWFDGIRWVPDADTQAERCAESLSRALLQDAANTPLKDYQGFAFKLQERGGMGGRNAMIADAVKHLAVRQTDFDANTRYLNLQNCVLDLIDMKAIPHNPDLLLSKTANVSFDKDASARLWDDFVWSVMDGNTEKMDFLQEAAGASLTGENEAETSIFLYGASTRNGKTCFSETMRFLLGDYAATINPEVLSVQKYANASAASPDIANLYGVRYLQASEPPRNMLLDAAKFKALTGRQEITARFLHSNPFTFTPGFLLFLNGNHLPRVMDETVFSSDRVFVVTFDRHFTVKERDPYLKQKLRDPEVLSAVLNWLLTGLARFRDHGSRFFPPECVEKALEEYSSRSNKITSFMDECTEESEKEAIAASTMYSSYLEWCQSNGLGSEGKRGFLDALRRNGLLADTGTVNGRTVRNVVKGYRLADPVSTRQPTDRS